MQNQTPKQISDSSDFTRLRTLLHSLFRPPATARIISAIILAVIHLTSSADAVTRLHDLVFTPLSQQTAVRTHGYIEHRVRITNESHKNRYTVRIQAPANPYFGNAIKSVERTVVLGPGMNSEVSMPTPPLNISGSATAMVYVNGSDWGKFPMASLSSRLSTYEKKIVIYTSRSIKSQVIEDALNTKHNKSPKSKKTPHLSRYSTTPNTFVVNRSEQELHDWSHNWLAYSCYDAVILAKSDTDSISETMLDTLRQYVAAGGVLALTQTLELPFKTDSASIRDNFGSAELGFGKILLFKDSAKNIPPDLLKKLISAAENTQHPWLHSYSLSTADKQFPVVSDISLPTRGMFMIMFLFSIVIGPVILIVLSRKNKRIWLLWMVPTLSLLVCILVTVYSIFSEGITPTVRTKSLTLLNQNTRQAVTIGILGLYCPLTPSGGLHFNPATEVSPYTTSNYGEGSGKSINWTRDQNLSSGWITARIPAYFQIRIPQARRERLELLNKDGKLEVINGLGADIRSLWLRDSNGAWFTINKKLESGAKATLRPDSKHKPNISVSNTPRSIYKNDKWPDKFKQIPDSRIELLQPNMYLAMIDGSPFLNHGLKGKVHQRSLSYVIGILPSQIKEEK